MKKTIAALALCTMALSTSANAQAEAIPTVLGGSAGLTAGAAAGIVGGLVLLAVVISDDDSGTTTTSTPTPSK